MHFPLEYRWFARTRFWVIIFCSIGLFLLLVNIYFIIFRVSETPISSASANASTIRDTQTPALNTKEVTREPAVKNARVFAARGNSSNSTLSSAPIRNRTEVSDREVGNMKNRFANETSNCEAVLAGSQWTLWNLCDLVLSSLLPFAFIFAFNVAIIVRISRIRKRRNTRPESIVLINRNRVRLTVTLEGEPQLVHSPLIRQKKQKARKNATAATDSRAEWSVTGMLLVTTFMFLAMRTPIVAGHSLQMLISEEKLFEFVHPVICMGALKTLPERMNHMR